MASEISSKFFQKKKGTSGFDGQFNFFKFEGWLQDIRGNNFILCSYVQCCSLCTKFFLCPWGFHFLMCLPSGLMFCKFALRGFHFVFVLETGVLFLVVTVVFTVARVPMGYAVLLVQVLVLRGQHVVTFSWI